MNESGLKWSWQSRVMDRRLPAGVLGQLPLPFSSTALPAAHHGAGGDWRRVQRRVRVVARLPGQRRREAARAAAAAGAARAGQRRRVRARPRPARNARDARPHSRRGCGRRGGGGGVVHGLQRLLGAVADAAGGLVAAQRVGRAAELCSRDDGIEVEMGVEMGADEPEAVHPANSAVATLRPSSRRITHEGNPSPPPHAAADSAGTRRAHRATRAS